MEPTVRSVAARSRRCARQLCRAYARVLGAPVDADGLETVLPYLARGMRAAWGLSRGNLLRSALNRVLITHVQLAHVPVGTMQRAEARAQLAEAVRDLEAIAARPSLTTG